MGEIRSKPGESYVSDVMTIAKYFVWDNNKEKKKQ